MSIDRYRHTTGKSQALAYQSLFPQARIATVDFSKLEQRVLKKMANHPNAAKAFKDAVTYGQSIHYTIFDELSFTMPRQLFSFHPARNNQIERRTVVTLADLQEAMDLNPDFTHISVVNDGKHWLIYKGPVTGKSASQHNSWKPISFNRLPKPIRTRLLIEPLGE
jgi:hypothetical protein